MTTRQQDLLADKVGTLLNLAEHLRDSEQLAEAGMETSLDRVQLLRQIESTAASTLRTAVHEAREQRATWAEVGHVLGTSPQAAQQRYTAPQRPPSSPQEPSDGPSGAR